jgi:hypothetical protein
VKPSGISWQETRHFQILPDVDFLNGLFSLLLGSEPRSPDGGDKVKKPTVFLPAEPRRPSQLS